MKIEQLIKSLEEKQIPKNWYSINESDKTDSFVLKIKYGIWEFYYFDERGNQSREEFFTDEDTACDFFWNAIEEEFKFYNRNKGTF